MRRVLRPAVRAPHATPMAQHNKSRAAKITAIDAQVPAVKRSLLIVSHE